MAERKKIKITYAPNDYFEGMTVDGIPNGEGVRHYASGDYYEGEFLNGKIHGKGRYVRKEGVFEYVGEFTEGSLTGRGKMTWKNGTVYEGDVVGGLLQGKGRLTYVGGGYYEGDFEKGNRTGVGKQEMKNGDVYIGHFLNGVLEGEGVYVFAGGNTYTGNFRNGKRNGNGKFKWASGDIFIGEFKDGFFHGKGQIIWKNGATYEGDFLEGKRTGFGILTKPDGEKLEGYFVDGKYVGKENPTGAQAPAAKEAVKKPAATKPAPKEGVKMVPRPAPKTVTTQTSYAEENATPKETTKQFAHDVYKGEEPFVFISYSHKDQEQVLPIIEAFEKNGIRYWYDYGIPKGSVWMDVIGERIEACHVVLAFISKNSMESQDCKQELYYAIEEKTTLFPCYLDDVRPERGLRVYFAGKQAIHADEMRSEALVKEIVDVKLFAECRK